MKHWWKRCEGVIEGDVIRRGYTKGQIEDITGKIPLLLDSCVVKDKEDHRFTVNLRCNPFKEIYKNAESFEQELKSSCKNPADLNFVCYTCSAPAASLTSLGTTAM